MKTLFKARINKDLLKFLLNQHKTLIAVYTVLFFALFPLTVITEILRPLTSNLMLSSNPELIPSALILFAIPVFIIAPFILFNYVFSKKAVNVMHAMPIRRRDLFVTLAFVSFVSVVVPFILNYLLGYGIAYLGTNVVFNVEHILNLFRLLVFLSALTSITILVISNTGALSEAIIYTGIALIVPFVGTMAISFFMQRFLLGYKDVSEIFLYYLTPITSIFKMYAQDFYSVDAFRVDIISSYWFIAIVIMSAISITIYNAKKSERSEQPFTNNVFFPIVASCFTVFLLIALISVFSPYNGTIFVASSFIMPIMISFIVFIVLNIIKNRSTKGLLFAVKNFIIIVVISIVISLTIVLTGGFGYQNRVPSSDKVERLVIEDTYQLNHSFPVPGSKFVIKEKLALKMFTEFHKEIIEEKKGDYENNPMDYTTLSFTYYYSNGTKMSRSYNIEVSKLTPFLSELSQATKIHTTIDALRTDDSINKFLVTSPFMDTTYDFKGSLNSILDVYLNELDGVSNKEFNSNGGKLVYNILISKKFAYQTMSLQIDERFVETIDFIKSNFSSHTIDNTSKSYSEIVIEDTPSSCAYSPFNGVVSNINAYYNCSMGGLSYSEVDTSLYDIYPFKLSDSPNLVIQSNYSSEDFEITLLFPVVKK